MTYQPRYVAFARANGRTPEEQHAIDAEKPIGRMLEFMLWIGTKRREWKKCGPEDFDRFLGV